MNLDHNRLLALKKKKINLRKYLIKNTKLSLSQITRVSYDYQSGNYVKSHKNLMRNKKSKSIFYKRIYNLFKYVNSDDIETVLDFGTGEATNLKYFLKYKKNIKKIYACDLSFNRLCAGNEHLKKELSKQDLSKISLFCNSDSSLPFKSNSIDVVITMAVLENMSDKNMKNIILELLRVSKKKLILVEPRNTNVSKSELIRMKKFKLNFNLNKILKKKNIDFQEDKWYKTRKNVTPYSIRVINKHSNISNNHDFFYKKENLILKKESNFFFSISGKVIPIINNITVFRPVKDLYYL